MTTINSPPSDPSGLDPSPQSEVANVEVEQIVTFVEEGEVATAATPSFAATDDYLAAATDALTHDVVGFLSRPVEIANFTWPAASAWGTVLHKMILPRQWLQLPMIREKTSGFRYLRCDFVVRVQVNAQPFNAGRLMIYFNPMVPQVNEDSLSALTHFGGITGFRHVDLDVSDATALEFRIPFLGPLSHFDLITGAGILGQTRLVVYSPLTGSTDVDGTIWLHAENIDIHMATGLPQFVFPTLNTSNCVEENTLVRSAQVQSKAERKAAKGGDVETIAKATSSIAKKLGSVPVIGDAAKAVSWIADAAGGVASIFGWSRPTDPSFSELVQPTFLRHLANYDGDAKSKPMGLDARNAIENAPQCTNSTEDEMSLAHLLGKQIYTNKFTMDNTHAPNTIIWRWPVDPTSCIKTAFTDSGRSYVSADHTMLSYIAQLFKFWRGGIKYNFKVVKTCFHSGRIRVTFVPGATADTLVGVDINKCYSQVFDIRDLTSFDFEVPFVYNLPWKKMDRPVNTVAPAAPCYEVPTGMIYVEVLNSLRNPTTAANSIEFLVETSAGEDFQFAFMTNRREFAPRISTSGGPASRVAQIQSFIPGKVMSQYNPNMLGIGEAVTSTRQMLKRYVPFEQDVNFHPNIEQILIYPYSATVEAPGYTITNVDLFTYVAQLFRFYSGGMRLLLQVAPSAGFDPSDGITSAEIVTETYILPSQPDGAPSRWWGPGTVPNFSGNAAPLALYYPALEYALELDIPFYRHYPVALTQTGTVSLSSVDFLPELVPNDLGTAVNFNCSAMTSGGFRALRSIGEDFSFAYSLGPPQGLHDLGPTPP